MCLRGYRNFQRSLIQLILSWPACPIRSLQSSRAEVGSLHVPVILCPSGGCSDEVLNLNRWFTGGSIGSWFLTFGREEEAFGTIVECSGIPTGFPEYCGKFVAGNFGVGLGPQVADGK